MTPVALVNAVAPAYERGKLRSYKPTYGIDCSGLVDGVGLTNRATGTAVPMRSTVLTHMAVRRLRRWTADVTGASVMLGSSSATAGRRLMAKPNFRRRGMMAVDSKLTGGVGSAPSAALIGALRRPVALPRIATVLVPPGSKSLRSVAQSQLMGHDVGL